MLMNKDYYIGQGDTEDPLRATLYDRKTGEPLDLTDRTVTFSMRTKVGEVLVDNEAAVVEEPKTAGKVHYVWKPGDTDVPGVHWGRFLVEVAEDRQYSAPNDTYINVHVTPF